MSAFELDRRVLLQATGAAGIAGFLGDLAGIGTAAADAATDDYKALVCVFLFGGNDGINMFVPTDSGAYSEYSNARSELAVAKSSLVPLAKTHLGLHPSLSALAPLWSRGQLTPVLGVGSLLAPTTKSDYKAQRHLPDSLFSHSDQQLEWMLGSPDNHSGVGWAGGLADALGQTGNLGMNISLSGINLMQTGRDTSSYALGSGGPVTFNARSNKARASVIDGLWSTAAASGDPFASYLGQRLGASRDLAANVASVLKGAPKLATSFPASSLGKQLANVAKMISVHKALGVKRQIFFVAQGGFDTHADQLADQPRLFSDLAHSLAAFQSATTELGLSKNVTAFTQSEFGRTLGSNGAGTDHGWSSHQLVVGGALKAGHVVGALPELALGTALEVGGGRFIPTTPVDAYAGTLARWFGASASDVAEIFPRLSRFDHTDLGLFATPAKKKPAKHKKKAAHKH